ncbi:MAG: HpcH/HpaI aldolase/citrate lyase family protein, partial [Caulobacteraceae bacterium]
MKATFRPRRSALYVPASNPRAMEKACSLPADVLILDLEDAVLPEAKLGARRAAASAVAARRFGEREVVVRVNALETPWGSEDLAAVAANAPDAVLVPKIRTRDDVLACEAALAAAPSSTRLWAMIETPQAVLAIGDIAAAGRETRLSGLVMGINDLARETRARQTPARTAFHSALFLAVAAARAYGLAVLDGVHNAIDDLAALEAACRQGVEFGFDGKTLIHPSHIEICNRVFSPQPEEIAWAQAVIAAF